MAIYNTTAVDNTTNIFDFIKAVNEIELQNGVVGVPAIVFLYLLFIIILAVTWAATKSPERAILYSSLSSTLIGSMMVFSGLLAWKIVAIPLVLLVGSIIYLFITE